MENKDGLFAVKENEYGDQYKDHFLKQYELYISSVEKISDRRQHANNYFITINTALISFIGLSSQIKILQHIEWLLVLLPAFGIIVCIIFWYLIRSYKQMNSGKFQVIHEIEKQLPLMLYKYEWEILEKGENPEVYYPFSHIELLLPWVFGAIYFLLVVLLISQV